VTAPSTPTGVIPENMTGPESPAAIAAWVTPTPRSLTCGVVVVVNASSSGRVGDDDGVDRDVVARVVEHRADARGVLDDRDVVVVGILGDVRASEDASAARTSTPSSSRA
jgi:hypothetical protein